MTQMILVEASTADKPDVAAWLLATADTMGVDRKLIQTRNKGFLVPVELLGDLPVSVTDVDVDTATVTVSVPMTPAELLETKVPELAPRVTIPEVEPDRETVRAWAKTQPDLDVADKGRISKAVYEAYKLAHA